MKRLHYVNLAGVLALGALCVAQWQHDRRLNLELNRGEKVRLDQSARLEEQDRTARGLNADLAQFKEQFARSGNELHELRQKLRAAEGEVRQLARERDQLKSSVTNWAEAVAARDERLREAAEQIRTLADDLNASIRRFNELATNYNALVRERNELRARGAEPVPAR